MLETERLVLRQWKDSDFPAFGQINMHSSVREFFYQPTTIESSIEMAKRLRDRIAKNGYGLWAVELKEGNQFLGFTGLANVFFGGKPTSWTEIAWRIDPAHWGKGYATEAARLALADGFTRIGLPEIIAYTVPHNYASRRVMEKIEMTHNPSDDFDHPDVPKNHKMSRMVFYRAQYQRNE
jgi:RimJ/RimL family protein N-acetyltransferase